MKRLLLNKYAALLFTAASLSALSIIIYAQARSGDHSMMDHDNCPMMKKVDQASAKHFDMVK